VVQRAPASLQRTTIRVALFVLGGVVVLSVAELTSERFNAFTRDHSLISTFMTEAILLVGVYLVIDQIIERRETRRWGDVMSLGIRAVSTRADGPAGIVRSAVDELDGADASLGALADRLRADDARARSFADELRRSASTLEEAIVQWGPTLVEDPESASLINLLPDIVDSARSAADAIAPSTTFRGWTAADRQAFEDSLLEILENTDEFQRRASERPHS
jgi:hypothetical protein